MARGTKTYINGKIRSSKYGTIIHTYDNVNPALMFQTGTIGEFQQAYYPDELDSMSCAEIMYTNEVMSQSFQKNDCSSGTGTYVTYTVDEGTYSSSISQEDANAQAQADINTNGQTYANNPLNGGTCLASTVNALVTIDMFDDDFLDVCAYIDTPGVVQSGNIVARDGLNFYETTDPAASAFMLASDNIIHITLKRRFIFNIGKLIGLYPDDVAIPEFIFKIRGRTSGAGGSISGTSQEEFPDVTMIMTGEPGSYIPSTTPTGGPATVPWNSTVIPGGDGSVGLTVGDVILTVVYNRATNTTTATGV